MIWPLSLTKGKHASVIDHGVNTGLLYSERLVEKQTERRAKAE